MNKLMNVLKVTMSKPSFDLLNDTIEDLTIRHNDVAEKASLPVHKHYIKNGIVPTAISRVVGVWGFCQAAKEVSNEVMKKDSPNLKLINTTLNTVPVMVGAVCAVQAYFAKQELDRINEPKRVFGVKVKNTAVF